MGDNDNQKVSDLEDLLGGREFQVLGLDTDFNMEIKGQPPCTMNCPSGVNAKAYVNLIGTKRYEEAFDVVVRNCTFPGICGRICTHPCQEACTLSDVGAIPIMELKRFVADYKYSHVPGGIYPPKSGETGEHIRLGKKIAVVGSGPAGCTSALDLAALGYDITLFESHDSPGGMLSQGIPDYRLPKKVVDLEMDYIRSSGVKIETSKKIDNADSLRKMGFDMIILAAGTMKDRRLPIEGFDKEGVIACMPFLRNVNHGNKEDIHGKVLVIGGGSSAFDCARVAKRLGAERVTIVYRRSLEEMPAMKEEIEEANEEGIEIQKLSIPVRIIGGDKVTSMEFIKADLGEVDESGRKRPVPREGTEFQLEADLVITAVGFTSDILSFSENLELTSQGTVRIDSNGGTNIPDIFAAGDVVSGPSSVIEAIASGHDAAYGVHLRLSKEKGQPVMLREMPVILNEPYKEKASVIANLMNPEERDSNFHEVNLGLSKNQALSESARCIRCASCFECAVCLGECDYKQISGSINNTRFLIKSTIDFSKIIYDSPKEVTFSSDSNVQKVILETLTAKVDPGFCIACGRCEEACGYRAVQVKIKMDEPMAAFVDHDTCKCCGACSAVCPTGAISQGVMSPEKVRELIQSIAKKEPVVFGCIWGRKNPVLSTDNVTIMCTRMIRPSMILEALALGIPGIIVNPCSIEDGCHYFPFEPSIEDIVCRTNDILDYAGLSSKRVIVRRFPSFEMDFVVNEFSKNLKEMEIGPIPESPFEGDNRISRSITWLMELHGSENMEEKIGNLALLYLFFHAEGFDVLDEMKGSVEKIIENEIMEKDIAHLSIKSILEKVKVPESLKTDTTVGLIPSSVFGLDPARVKEILSQIEGLKVITLKPPDDLEINKLNSRTKGLALELLKQAQESGVDVLVPLSILDLVQLKLYTREGSWSTTQIMVKDIFSILNHLSSISGGEV
jgi:NADPH-dependent glutamate synthase beta subunit-like oxidoreductase/coenzyme F420-reducing hydrogenase delta subunit/Pyruvate/2-oxoacid:ferredoxin oxidoreductase delta subunit